MWTTKLDLGNWVETLVDGYPVRTLEYRTVFANKKSIRQSEFYQADNVGLRPELMFEIHSHEYAGTEVIRYPQGVGVEHSIIRTYERGAVTEVVCAAKVGMLNG